EEDEGRFGMSAGRIAMIIGGAVATIVVAVLVVVLPGDGETPPPPNDFGNTPSAQEPADSPGTADDPSLPGSGASSSGALTSAERRATNVAVLNGTTQTGLARSVGDEIQKAGFKIGGVATNADQSVPTTIVAYTAGNERAAREVAKIIGVDSGSVQAADANTVVAAEADVVVTVGADKLG
ncbi:MAG TPA: LytR C-terminal domain-containing protein, partial [Solirubrobacteraceae bacterium]|nr:LytR C-terminal domain-containing protein [Solirubrobacteraceae bacterium]